MICYECGRVMDRQREVTFTVCELTFCSYKCVMADEIRRWTGK